MVGASETVTRLSYPYAQMFFKQRTQGLYMRSDAHGERAQKVYALDYCAASFVTEGELICALAYFARASGRGMRLWHMSS